jgi:hypothetical protein
MKLTRLLGHMVSCVGLMFGILAVFALWGGQVLPASADSMAFVRVIHASPAAGPVDVFVDGSKLLTNFQFATVTGYVPVPAGAHKIQVAPAGKGAGKAVITQTVIVNAGVPYIVAALGTKAGGFSLGVFGDDNIVSSGMAKLRVYHLSPDAGPVNLAVSGKTVINGLSYQQSSGYFSVAAGSYIFDVTATQANVTVQMTADLKDGTVTSVFAVGLLKGTPKIQFVPVQVTGVPGMPSTGSDPHALPATGTTPKVPTGWLLAVICTVVIGATLIARRLVLTSSKEDARSQK